MTSYTSTPTPTSSRAFDFKKVNITPLTAPGPDSNYLDWSFAIEIYLEAAGLEYLLADTAVKDRPTTWASDTKTVIALFVQVVSEPNFQAIRKHRGDAHGMWKALRAAHQDHTSGGRIHWLYKLLLSRMDPSDDLPTHIKKMRGLYEHFASLLSVDKPLQPNDIFSASLIISLPPDLLQVVRPLMSNPSTTSEDVINALTQDDTFSKTRKEMEITESTVSKARVDSTVKTEPKVNLFCTFCKRDGHDLEQCYTARKILEENRGHPNNSRRHRSGGKSKSRVKAGRVSTTTISDDDSNGPSSDESSTIIFAKSVRSGQTHPTKARDANVDSGCSQSMTPHSDQLTSNVVDSTNVRLADDSLIKSTHRGTLKSSTVPGISHTALLVPALSEPLLSVAGHADDGLVTVFNNEGVSFFDKSSFKVTTSATAYGERRGNLYYLPEKASHHCLSSVSTSIDHSLFDWHVVFNHIGLKALKLTLKSLGIKPTLLNEIEVQQCPICVQSKMSRLSFGSRSSHRDSRPGEIIHTDVCSFENVSREGFSMWVTFIDDYSKNTAVYPLKLKSHTFQSFRHYRAAFEKQHSCSILTLVSDNGGEYMGKEFQQYLLDAGILHEPGPPHSPQLNGVAERTNRTLCDRLRCCLLGAQFPKSFWVDALRHLVFTMNSIPCYTPSGFQSPNTINDLDLVNPKYLHPFGCC